MASIELLCNQPSTPPRSNHIALLVVDNGQLYQKHPFRGHCIGRSNDMFTKDLCYHGNNYVTRPTSADENAYR